MDEEKKEAAEATLAPAKATFTLNTGYVKWMAEFFQHEFRRRYAIGIQKTSKNGLSCFIYPKNPSIGSCVGAAHSYTGKKNGCTGFFSLFFFSLCLSLYIYIYSYIYYIFLMLFSHEACIDESIYN